MLWTKMADLTIPKKRQIERLLQMDDGYVLNYWCLRHSLLIRQPLSDRSARRTWATGLHQIP